MCGLFGVIDRSRPISLDEVKRSLATIAYRGPDDEGVYRQGCVALGHRRLSIIDTSVQGRQPLFSEDRRISIVFNGEIYNFAEQVDALKRTGHVFSSHTDSEVVIHLYEEHGPEVVRYLDGMFSFALYDERANRVLLARDPFGKKPLYYTVTRDRCLFSSELKAIACYPGVALHVSEQALASYLACDYVPNPCSIYEHVYKLPAGSRACISLNAPALAVKPELYYTVQFEPKQVMDEREAVQCLDTIAAAAVRKRLVSDVPLGVFLSGGLDSSLVAAYAQRACGSTKVKTFCIGFTEAHYDESLYARRVARYLGTEHYEERFEVNTLLELLPTIIDVMDEPLADASLLHTYLLSQFARKHVTVALGGDGNDELFAGYDPFVAIQPARIAAAIPGIRMLLHALSTHPWVCQCAHHMSLGFRLRHFAEGLRRETHAALGTRIQTWMSSFSPECITRMLGTKTVTFDDLYHDVAARVGASDAANDIDRAIAAFLFFYMHDSILAKVDRMSMANSLEVRSPFLDRAYAACVNTLPASFKLRHGTRKYLYRLVCKGKVPDDIIRRPKKGFGIPTGLWLTHELKEQMHFVLHNGKMARTSPLDLTPVRVLYDRHCQGRGDFRKELWNILILGLWWERHV